MRINFINRPTMPVKDVPMNRTFTAFDCGSVFIKIDINEDTALYMSGDGDGKNIPALNLVNGRLYWLDPNEVATPLESELRIIR